MPKPLRRLLVAALTLVALFLLVEQRVPLESLADELVAPTPNDNTERTVGDADERFRSVALGQSAAEVRAFQGQPVRQEKESGATSLAYAHTPTASSRHQTTNLKSKPMTEVKLMVLYPHPTDVTQFDSDYSEHLRLLHEKANIPEDERPYTVTKFLPTPEGPAPYYQLFTMPFPSAEAFQEAMSSPGMQEVAADAVRISTGGAPVVLVGNEE